MVFDDEMLTIDEVATYLKLKPQTIYKWAQAGKIPGAKFGKEWRFRRSSIEEWIDLRISSAGSASSSSATSSPKERSPPGATDAGGSSASDSSRKKPLSTRRRSSDSGPSKN